jgi:hypothetical protein
MQCMPLMQYQVPLPVPAVPYQSNQRYHTKDDKWIRLLITLVVTICIICEGPSASDTENRTWYSAHENTIFEIKRVKGTNEAMRENNFLIYNNWLYGIGTLLQSRLDWAWQGLLRKPQNCFFNEIYFPSALKGQSHEMNVFRSFVKSLSLYRYLLTACALIILKSLVTYWSGTGSLQLVAQNCLISCILRYRYWYAIRKKIFLHAG